MKKFIKGLAALVAAVSLVACGNAGSNQGNNTVVDKSKTLVVYSNSVSGGRGDWLTAKAKEAGFNIQLVEMGGGELADRVIAEKNNSVADMVYGIGALDINKLKAQDILTPFTPSWKDKIDASLADANGLYHPMFVTPLLLMGKPGLTDMPKDWTELSSKYKGRYMLYGLSGGTARAVMGSILIRYQDPNGTLGVSEEGWKVIKDLVQNAYFLVKGEEPVAKLMDDKDPIDFSMIWSSKALADQKKFNTKVEIMTPEIGVPFVTEQIAILKSSKNQPLAKEFINWFGQASIVEEYSKQFGSIPANKEAKVGDDIKELLSKVKSQSLDWEVIGKNLDKWIEKIMLEYVH